MLNGQPELLKGLAPDEAAKVLALGQRITLTSGAELFHLGAEAASLYLVTQGRIKLILPDGLEVRQLYQIASDQNVQIRRLSHKRDSLEDIFLKAMETTNGRL